MTNFESGLPELCIQEQLDCVSCTNSTAKELADACPRLPARAVARLFVQIHPHPGCARMLRNFNRAYSEAVGEEPAPLRPVLVTGAAA